MIELMGSEVIFRGSWNEYEWKIVDYDIFRSVYIELPQNHPYYGRDYNDVPINCHGGLTYSGPLNGDGKYWIGWDYMCVPSLSTEEIFGEIKDVIRALKAASCSIGPTIWEEVHAMDKEAFADWLDSFDFGTEEAPWGDDAAAWLDTPIEIEDEGEN